MGPIAVAAPPPARRRDAIGPVLGAPLLGMAGPLVLWPAALAHLALPVTVARHLRGECRGRFAAEDAPRIADGLEWLLGAYAWAALLVAPAPWAGGARPVRLGWAPPAAPPTAAAALGRLATGLPAAIGELALGALALVPWLAGVGALLATGRVPAPLARVQVALLGRRARLLRRQACLQGASARA